MKAVWYTVLAMLLLLTSCVKVPDGTLQDDLRNREIKFAVWVPESTEPAPLIVLSHGSGGHYSNFNWLTRVLVEHGYVVAAVNHPFNTTGNDTPEGVARAWDRPPDLSLLISELLSNPEWAAAIDSTRIGATGFSSGGYTVLALAGAVYDIDQMHAYCNSTEAGPECGLAVALPAADPDASSLLKDPRIKAVFAMAPGWGAATRSDSLEAIDIPVKIVAAEDDEILIPAHHAVYFDELIPDSVLVMLPKGGHFIFLSCSPMTRVADWFIDRFNLCGIGIDVDRDAVQKETAALAVQFFDQHLRAVE
nr:esterase/lipase [uncultured bacterium]